MYFQFLVEDPSGEEFIHQIMGKMAIEYPETEYRCKSFHGIGGFTKINFMRNWKHLQIITMSDKISLFE